jgi:hypothetical protein
VNAPAGNWTRFWFASAVALSIFCLLVTFFNAELAATPAIPRIVGSFDLTGENSIGAWWSGMLLLLAAVHMTDGVIQNRDTPRLAAGWFCVAGVLVLLSADEVGSVHERLGTWGRMWPFALALAAGLGLGILALWTSGQRSAVLWIVAAFCLFVSVAGQEYLEHNTRWWGDQKTLRATIEEGCELLAMLMLLRVGLRNSSPPSAALSALREWKGTISLAVMAAAAPLAYYSAGFADARGYVSAWLGAACFLLAGLAIARRDLAAGRAFPGAASVLLALLCVLASVNAVVHNPTLLPNRGYLVLMVVLLAMAALAPATIPRDQRRRYLAVVAASVGLVAVSWNFGSLFVTYTALTAVAGLMVYAHADIGERKPAGANLHTPTAPPHVVAS